MALIAAREMPPPGEAGDEEGAPAQRAETHHGLARGLEMPNREYSGDDGGA